MEPPQRTLVPIVVDDALNVSDCRLFRPWPGQRRSGVIESECVCCCLSLPAGELAGPRREAYSVCTSVILPFT